MSIWTPKKLKIFEYFWYVTDTTLTQHQANFECRLSISFLLCQHIFIEIYHKFHKLPKWADSKIVITQLNIYESGKFQNWNVHWNTVFYFHIYCSSEGGPKGQIFGGKSEICWNTTTFLPISTLFVGRFQKFLHPNDHKIIFYHSVTVAIM